MSSISGSRGVCMFVPTSVERRSRGLRRVPGQYNQWVPVAVVDRMQASVENARVRRMFQDIMKSDPTMIALSSGRSWGDIICDEQDRHDAPFVAMSSQEFIALCKSNSIPKSTVARIFKKREAKWNTKPAVIVPAAPDSEYRYWLDEYTNYPHCYFKTQQEQDEALRDLEVRFSKKLPVQGKPLKNMYAALMDSDDE